MSTEMKPRKRRRPLRTLIRFGLLVLVLGGVLVALLPTMINRGLGRGVIAGMIEDEVNGSVEIETIRLSWWGGQGIEGLVVTDAGGVEVVNLDVEVEQGLFDILRGGAGTIEARVGGALKGEMREDGSMSFGELLADGSRGANSQSSAAASSGSSSALPGLVVLVKDLQVGLRDAAADREYEFTAVEGEVRIVPGGASSVVLESPATCGGMNGSVSLDLAMQKVLDAAGAFTPAGAGVEISLVLEGLPVPLDEGERWIERLEVTGETDDLAESLEVSLNAVVRHDAETASELTAQVSATSLFDRSGDFNLDMNSLMAEVEGRDVPGSMLQPFLVGMGIDAVRDFGEQVTVSGALAASPDESAVQLLTLSMETDRMQLEFQGKVETEKGLLHGESFHLEQRVDPGLLREMGSVEVDRPVLLAMEGRDFIIPLPDAEGAVDFSHSRGMVTVETRSPFRWTPDPATLPVEIENISLTLGSESLERGVMVSGQVRVEGADIRLDGTGILPRGEGGRWDLYDSNPRGTLVVRDCPVGALLARAPDFPEELISAGDGSLNMRIEIENTLSVPGFSVHADTPGGTVEVAGEWRRGYLDFKEIEIKPTASDEQMRALLDWAGIPESTGSMTKAIVSVSPWTLTLPGKGRELEWPSSLAVRLDMDELVVKGAGEERWGWRAEQVNLGVAARLGDRPDYTIKGATYFYEEGGTTPLAHLVLDMTAQTLGGEIIPEGTLELRQVHLSQVEQAWGQSPGALVDWLGEAGNVVVTLEGSPVSTRAQVAVVMPSLQGDFKVDWREGLLSLGGSTATLTLTPAGFERWMRENPRPWRLQKPTGVQVRLQECALPGELLRGEAFEGSAVGLNLEMSSEGLTLLDEAGREVGLNEVSMTVATKDLDQGVMFNVAAATDPFRANPQGVGETAGGIPSSDVRPGRVDVSGTANHLMSPAGRWQPDQAVLHLNAMVDHLPTVLVDAAGHLEGMLTAAAGGQLEGTIVADGFSAHSGSLVAEVKGTQGWLKLRAAGREGTIVLEGDDPLTGELEVSPALRQRLLEKVHPILADIRATEHPLRLTVTRAVIPADGSMKGLSGDFLLEVGPVAFDSGSTTLGVLDLFQTSRETTPGLIEPVAGHIRDGVLTYDRFAVHVGAYTMVYEGQVDLVRGMVNLKTEVPLQGLTHTFKELKGITDDISVPLITKGPIDDPVTKLDEDALGKILVEQGIRGALGNILEKEGIPSKPLQDLLGGIFGGGRKD